MCGCVYINGDIDISLTVDTTPLVESNFSFFYHIKEIRGFLYLQDIPEIERLSFPNLIIIRGESLNMGFAIIVFNSKIGTLYMPKLTEITNGNVGFSDNMMNDPVACNVKNIDWEDILSDSSSTTTINLPQCTDTSELPHGL